MTKRENDARVYPDELHKELGMTPEEVRQSYVDRGVDPDAVVASMRRLGRLMAAKFAPQAKAEAELTETFGSPMRLFEETVAAGPPAWAGAASPSKEASLRDVMACGTADDTILAHVSGWSMRDAGINDGDYVMVNVKIEAKDGDIVLAHLAGEGQVVKRLRKGRGKVALVSANPDFPDIVVEDANALRIHGVVVGRAGKL